MKKEKKYNMAERRFSEDEPIMVSIRCITYNHAPYIRQCLEGFVMQKTNFRFQAVVHDDASTDGTTDIVREYAEKYPDIIVPMYEEENQWSKHDGTLLTIMYPHMLKGKYWAECEGDDYWIDPYKLQKQYDALEKHPECTIAFCKVKDVSRKGTDLKTTKPGNYMKSGIVTLKDFLKFQYGKGKWVFQTSGYFYRTNLFVECMNTEFRKKHPVSDEPLVIEYLWRGNGYYIDEICSCYRVQSGGHTSHTKSNPELAVSFQKKIIEAVSFLDEYTDRKYHNYIEYRKLIACFYIDYFKGNYKYLFKIKYWKLWFVLSKKTLFIMYLRFICPPLYWKLKGYRLSH